MDAKRVAIIIGMAVLIPLFLGLFVDAVYTSPQYENYCNNSIYTSPVYKEPAVGQNCSYDYGDEYNKCTRNKGNPVMNYTTGCSVYSS